MLLLCDALYAHGVQVYLSFVVSLIKLGFFFNFHTDGLDIFHGGNVFGQATLKNYFDFAYYKMAY